MRYFKVALDSTGNEHASVRGARPRRRLLRTIARRLGLGMLIAAGLFVTAVIGTARWGDRSLWPAAPGAPATEIHIVSHGYHAGIVLPRRSLLEQAGRPRPLPPRTAAAPL